MLPCRYLASWEQVEQSGFGTVLVCFCKTQETKQRPASACDGRRANLESGREREWEVKNEEQNRSMSVVERELTALFGALRHFNLCSKFQDLETFFLLSHFSTLILILCFISISVFPHYSLTFPPLPCLIQRETGLVDDMQNELCRLDLIWFPLTFT